MTFSHAVLPSRGKVIHPAIIIQQFSFTAICDEELEALWVTSPFAIFSICGGKHLCWCKKLSILHSLQAMQVFEAALIIGAFQADLIIRKWKSDSQEPSEGHLGAERQFC